MKEATTVEVARLRYVPLPPALLAPVHVACFPPGPIKNRMLEECVAAYSAAVAEVNGRLDAATCLQGTEPNSPAAAACQAATTGAAPP